MLIIQRFIFFLAQLVSLTYDLNGFMCIVNTHLESGLHDMPQVLLRDIFSNIYRAPDIS